MMLDEESESAVRERIYSSLDETVVQLRDKVKIVLGKERSAAYFSYFKEWLCGKRSQKDFDDLGLMMMPSDQKQVHTDFFLAMVNTCEISLRDIEMRRTYKWKKEKRISDDEPQCSKSPPPARKKIRLVSEFRHSPMREVYDVVPLPQESTDMLNDLGENVRPYIGWLPGKGEVKGRTLLAAWELGLDHVHEEALDCMVDSIKTLVASVLEETLKMKRPHLINNAGYCHAYGVRARKNNAGLGLVHVTTPARTPISAVDIVDMLQVNEKFIYPPWLRSQLIYRMELGTGRLFQREPVEEKKITGEV